MRASVIIGAAHRRLIVADLHRSKLRRLIALTHPGIDRSWRASSRDQWLSTTPTDPAMKRPAHAPAAAQSRCLKIVFLAPTDGCFVNFNYFWSTQHSTPRNGTPGNQFFLAPFNVHSRHLQQTRVLYATAELPVLSSLIMRWFSYDSTSIRRLINGH